MGVIPLLQFVRLLKTVFFFKIWKCYQDTLLYTHCIRVLLHWNKFKFQAVIGQAKCTVMAFIRINFSNLCNEATKY